VTARIVATNYEVPGKQVICDFTDFASWAANNVVKTADSTYQKYGSSVRCDITANSSARVTRTGLTGFTLSGPITLAIYCPTLPVSGHFIQLDFSSDGFSAKYAFYRFDVNFLKPGWNYLTVHPSTDANTAISSAGTPNTWQFIGGELLTNTFTGVRVQFVNMSGYTVYCAGVVINNRSRPNVMMMFDDGWLSQYTEAYAYMKTVGLRGAIACVPAFIGLGLYMSVAQYQTLYDAEWDITNHTLNHTVLTGIADELIRSEVKGGRDFLYSKGWNRAADLLIYPETFNDLNVQTVSQSVGATFGRGAIRRTAPTAPYGLDNPMSVGGATLSNVTLAKAKSFVDGAILTGESLIIYGHEILGSNNPGGLGGTPPATPTQWYRDDFRALVDYIVLKRNQGLIDTPTLTEWLNGLACQRLM